MNIRERFQLFVSGRLTQSGGKLARPLETPLKTIENCSDINDGKWKCDGCPPGLVSCQESAGEVASTPSDMLEVLRLPGILLMLLQSLRVASLCLKHFSTCTPFCPVSKALPIAKETLAASKLGIPAALMEVSCGRKDICFLLHELSLASPISLACMQCFYFLCLPVW